MTLFNWKRLSLSTATIIFFILATLFNIYASDCIPHTTYISINLTCMLLCQLGVILYSKFIDAPTSPTTAVEESIEQVHFCEVQRKVLAIMSICFIIWMI